eukprot:scaffold3226_cov160-Amphora_coffeaeformis.AAC.18
MLEQKGDLDCSNAGLESGSLIWYGTRRAREIKETGSIIMRISCASLPSRCFCRLMKTKGRERADHHGGAKKNQTKTVIATLGAREQPGNEEKIRQWKLPHFQYRTATMTTEIITSLIAKASKTAIFEDSDMEESREAFAHRSLSHRVKGLKEQITVLLQQQQHVGDLEAYLDEIFPFIATMWLERRHVSEMTKINTTMGFDMEEKQKVVSKMVQLLPQKECYMFSFRGFFEERNPTVPLLEITEPFFRALAQKDELKKMDLMCAPIQVHHLLATCFRPNTLDHLSIGVPGDDFLDAEGEDEEDFPVDRMRLLEFISFEFKEGQSLMERLVEIVSSHGHIKIVYESSDAQSFVKLCQQISLGLDGKAQGSL